MRFVKGELEIEIRYVGVPPETFVVEVRRGDETVMRADGELSYDDGPSILRWRRDVPIPDAVRWALDRSLGTWEVRPEPGEP